MQLSFGKLNPFEIICVPTNIFILLFSISAKIFLALFAVFKKSLENIFIFFSGNFNFSSSNIFSTPGPYISKLHNLFLILHFLSFTFLKPQ